MLLAGGAGFYRVLDPHTTPVLWAPCWRQVVHARLPPLVGDRRRLVHALSNMVGNAIKFTGTKVSAVLEPAAAAP